MKQLGETNLIEVPKQPFGFVSMPEHADKTFLEAFAPQLKQYNPQALEKTLDGEFYFDENGLLKGSNPILLTLANQHNLFPAGEHLLSISEFGKAQNEGQERFRGTYQETGLIVRASDSYQAQYLSDQIKKREITPNQEEPVIISLTDLTPIEDQNSKYGFSFKIKDDAALTIAPVYGTAETTKTFNLYDAQGIPIPDKSGTKQIWESSVGVASVWSSSGLDANSGVSRLAFSNCYGRVVVGSAIPQEYI